MYYVINSGPNFINIKNSYLERTLSREEDNKIRDIKLNTFLERKLKNYKYYFNNFLDNISNEIFDNVSRILLKIQINKIEKKKLLNEFFNNNILPNEYSILHNNGVDIYSNIEQDNDIRFVILNKYKDKDEQFDIFLKNIFNRLEIIYRNNICELKIKINKKLKFKKLRVSIKEKIIEKIRIMLKENYSFIQDRCSECYWENLKLYDIYYDIEFNKDDEIDLLKL